MLDQKTTSVMDWTIRKRLLPAMRIRGVNPHFAAPTADAQRLGLDPATYAKLIDRFNVRVSRATFAIPFFTGLHLLKIVFAAVLIASAFDTDLHWKENRRLGAYIVLGLAVVMDPVLLYLDSRTQKKCCYELEQEAHKLHAEQQQLRFSARPTSLVPGYFAGLLARSYPVEVGGMVAVLDAATHW
ncbi:hypothetical protein DFJ77DRAFT_514110 [Powellomyces hirtus]|nr:hypothetical protein DFJ77DRAFT_514110 [Powellomyces hirtus]